MRVLLTILALSAAMMLSACYENPDVTVYEPGVYKGDRDPLLAKHGTPEQKEALANRFTLIQADR
jgi:hypothetical protein